MSLTTCGQIEITLHTTNLWLENLIVELGWEDRDQACRALQVVLHALRDRLPVEAVAALGAQLPLLARGIYYEGWDRPGSHSRRARRRISSRTHRGGLPEQPGGRSGERRRGRYQASAAVRDVREDSGCEAYLSPGASLALVCA